jgi:hypothetical protein
MPWWCWRVGQKAKMPTVAKNGKKKKKSGQ